MKRLFLVLFFLLIATTQVQALLPIGIYGGVRGGIGGSNSEAKVDASNFVKGSSSPFASINGGVKFLKLRGELEYLYRYNAVELALSSNKKESSTKQIMANVYYDFFDFLLVSLYVNGGVGTNKIDSSVIKNYSKSIWSVGLGASVSLLLMKIDVGYRYFNLGNIEVGANKLKQESHDIYLGLRMGLGI
jgi:opacity protein-like surface antigen